MPYGLPNDPAVIGRWPSPGWFWASRWCTATRLRSVTAVHALLAEVSDVFLRLGYSQDELLLFNVYLAREKARRGDHDEAIQLMMSPLSLHRSWSGVGSLRPVLTRY